MDLPRYFLFGDLPVKMVKTEDGGFDVLSYNWITGEFETAPTDYLARALFGNKVDDEEVSEEDFKRHLKNLRTRLGKNNDV